MGYTLAIYRLSAYSIICKIAKQDSRRLKIIWHSALGPITVIFLSSRKDYDIMVNRTRIIADRKHAYDSAECALDDADAALILYERKNYSRAIFHLQQCVEQACKSFAYGTGLADDKLIRNRINHTPSRVFSVIIEYFLNNSTVYNKAIDSYNLLVKEKFPDKPELAQMWEDWENEFKEYHADFRRLEEIKSYTSDEIRIALDLLGQTTTGIDNGKTKLIEQLADKNEETKNNLNITMMYIDLMDSLIVLMILAVLCQGHESESRYPGKSSPRAIYTQDHPLIVHFQELHKYSVRAAENMKKTSWDILTFIKTDNKEKS